MKVESLKLQLDTSLIKMPPFFFEPPSNIKLRGIGLEKAPVEASLEVRRHHESQAVFSMTAIWIWWLWWLYSAPWKHFERKVIEGLVQMDFPDFTWVIFRIHVNFSGCSLQMAFFHVKKQKKCVWEGFLLLLELLTAIFRVTHSSHFTIMFFLKQPNSHFANSCLATYAIFPAPNKINFSSIPPHKKTLGKPCTATPCTQATRWRSVWAAKNVHSGDLSDARWIGPWHERPLPASPGGAVQAAFWMNDLIFAPSCSPPQKKVQSVKKQAGCFSQTAEPRLSLCTFLCCGGGFSTFQDGIGKLLPELVQSSKDAWQGDQSSLVKKPWKTNGWKPKIDDLEVFLLFQGDFTGSGGARNWRAWSWWESRVAALFRNEIQLTNYKILTLFHAAYTSPRFLANVDIFQNKKEKKEL